jgi:hypothetical protein
MTDRTTKFLLAAIALGLFANVATSLIRPAAAQQVENYLANIAFDMHALVNGGGNCRNEKICD